MKTSDKVLTFTAIFISCLALVVSIMQTRIMQKQSHAAVWPRLSNSQSFGPDYFEYIVTNEGVGPAIVKSIKYTYKDTSFQKIEHLILYFGRLEVQKTGNPLAMNFDFVSIYPGGVLAASEKNKVFIGKDSANVALGKKYLLETDIQLEYCSIYETCWRMQNDEILELD